MTVTSTHDGGAAQAVRLRPDWLWTGDELLRAPSISLAADGTIAAIAVEGAAQEGSNTRGAGDAPELRLPSQVLMPGLCDAHSHAFQRAFRGHVQHRRQADGTVSADSFWSWRDAMYRVANVLDPDGVEAVSALAFLELLRAGVTAVGEFHYLHNQADGTPYTDPDELALRVREAAARVGLRIALLRVVYGAAGIGSDGRPLPLRDDQRRFGCADAEAGLVATSRLAARLGADRFARVGLAVHSVRAVPRSWLRPLAAWRGQVHAHVAEQPAEVQACHAAFGVGPLQLLADAGLVHGSFAAVHLTHPGPNDGDLLRSADASIVVCPSTELDLGDGLLPLALRAGVRLCVGSDSYAAVEPLAEARTLELHGRAQSGRRVLLGDGSAGGQAAAVLAAASAHGHHALGLPGGRVCVGAPADLCAVDLDRPEALGVPPLLALSHVARPEWVRHVWVGGRHLLRDRRHAEDEAIVRAARVAIDVALDGPAR